MEKEPIFDTLKSALGKMVKAAGALETSQRFMGLPVRKYAIVPKKVTGIR